MKSTNPDWQEVQRAQQGDAAALVSLWQRYAPQIRRYLCSKIKERADRDDLVSQVLVKMMHGLAKLRDPAQFQNWLFTIVNNQVRMYYRSRQRNRVFLMADIVLNESATEENEPDEIFDKFLLSQARVVNPNQEPQFNLKRFTPMQRRVINLHYGLGYNYREVAGAVGKSEAAIKKMIERIKVKFRKVYGLQDKLAKE